LADPQRFIPLSLRRISISRRNGQLFFNSAGFFAISENSLVTERASILAGIYSVRVHANGTTTRFSGNAVFHVAVNIAPPPPPTLSLAVSPLAPTIPSSTPLGATVATLRGVWSDGSSFTGSYTFVSPNYDADTYSISGSNLIVAANGPGVGSAGGSVEQVTMEAVQIALTADGVTSSAPTGAPLATSAGRGHGVRRRLADRSVTFKETTCFI
jgi:hypothetical protein